MACKNRTNEQTNIIAIDGPAGSGKSTVAKGLAKRLGFLYVDTGAMYRALTLAAVREGINLSDEEALAKLALRVNIQFPMHKEVQKVLLDGEDVSRAIRKQPLTEKVRFLAKLPGVRAEMVKLQRRLVKEAKGAVLEGRDIGTVVFPNAKYKFYLDARIQERVKRRFKEMQEAGQGLSAEEIGEDIYRRDKSDITRTVAPLAKAKDAFYIDTTQLSVDEAIKVIVDKCSIR